MALLKFGVMIDSPSLMQWQQKILEDLAAIDGVECALVIESAGSDETPKIDDNEQRPLWKKLIRLALGKVNLYSVYNRVRLRPRLNILALSDLPKELAEVPRIRCQVIRKGRFSQYFDDGDISRIKQENLAFVLRFGFGIIRGKIHQCARYGIWSYHHGDLHNFRGAPPCVWEMVTGSDLVGVTLQRLTDKLDAGVVLQQAFFRIDPTSVTRSKSIVYKGSTHLVAKVCRDILRGHCDYVDADPAATVAPIYQVPNNRTFLRLAFSTSWRKVVAKCEWLFRHIQWGVGIIEYPMSHLLSVDVLPETKWLPNKDANRYVADPFGVSVGDLQHVYVEELEYATGKGHISYLQLRDGEVECSRTALNQPTHLSYPFLFEYQDQWYCVPESAASGRQSLYRLSSDFSALEKIRDFNIAEPIYDATLFEHDGRWWMFATIRRSGPAYQLCVWYADSPLSTWQAHGANPLSTDISKSRSAGPVFVHNHMLVRPAQDCSKEYGRAVGFYRINKLTTEEFEEEHLNTVNPDPKGKYPRGFHTVSPLGPGRTLVDGKRHRFSPASLGQTIRQQLRHNKWFNRDRSSS